MAVQARLVVVVLLVVDLGRFKEGMNGHHLGGGFLGVGRKRYLGANFGNGSTLTGTIGCFFFIQRIPILNFFLLPVFLLLV